MLRCAPGSFHIVLSSVMYGLYLISLQLLHACTYRIVQQEVIQQLYYSIQTDNEHLSSII